MSSRRKQSSNANWLGKIFWDSEAAKHPHVIDYYLRGGKDRLTRRVTSLTSLLSDPDTPLQPGEVLPALMKLRSELNREDPHYFYDLHLTQDLPVLGTRPGVVLTQTQGVADEGFVTVEVFAKFPDAELDRPITGEMTFTVQDEEHGLDLRNDWRELEHYGRPIRLPAEANVRVTVDAPGGLGGSFEGVQAVVAGAPTEMIADELTLTVIEPSGNQLATLSLAVGTPPTWGTRGFRLEARGEAFQLGVSIDAPGEGQEHEFTMNLEMFPLTGRRPRDVIRDLRFLGQVVPPNRLSTAPEN